MTAASPRDARPQVLGVFGGAEFAIGRTAEPWTLPIDMLTISAGPMGGLGVLGDTLRSVMPDIAWDSIDDESLAQPQRLVLIHRVEAEFLPRVASFLATPRAVKKAVNLYVLLRATIPDAELDAFLGDEQGGQFQAVAFPLLGHVSVYRPWARTVARYSFESYALFEDEPGL